MTESKLFQVIRTFSAEEFKEFRKLVNSPFFNKEGDYILRFVDYIKKYHPELRGDTLKKETIFRKLYPGRKYEDVTMRKISSVTQKLAETFLIQKNLYKKELDTELLLMEECTTRGLGDLFEKKAAALEKELYSDTEVNASCFDRISKFEETVYNYYLTHPKDHLASEHHIKHGENFIINSIIRSLHLYQDLRVSRTSHNQFNEKQTVEVFIENFNRDKMLRFLEEKKIDKKYIVEIFYFLLKANLNPEDDESYYELKDAIFSNFSKFEKNFKIRTLSFFLNNLCTEKIKLGRRDFYHEIFENYKIMLEHGLYVNPGNNYFHLAIYRAILITAVSINEIKWLEEFIEKYRDTLQPDLRENLINYAYGYLYYYKKEYEKSLTYFNKVKFDIFLFKLDVKNFMLMTYYTLGHIEEALALIDTYKHFLSDNQMISANMNEIATNFVNFVSALLKIRNGKGDKISAEMLKKKIEDTAIVGFKMWLLEKADELVKEMK